MCWGNMRGISMAFGKGIGLMGKVGCWGRNMVTKCWGMVENWGMSNNSWLFNMMGNSLDFLECWMGNCFGLKIKKIELGTYVLYFLN